MRGGDEIGHYRLQRDLGAGAFATVWLAIDQYLDDPVAIKILADNWARHDDVRRRFIEEAKIMRRIDHPRIVRVFAVDELPTGQPMFVMTYADRLTLADRIRDRRAQARRFDNDEVAALMIELADCLAVVHDFGVVHRDLKPSNVLFRTPRRHEQITSLDGDVMVLGDFGLAKDTIAFSGFTLAAGTPAYMPPEQARATSELDHRADLYSATAIMFELLTGMAPFEASTLSDVGRTRQERRLLLDAHRGDLAPAWQQLIDIGLAPEPGRRFQSATELADAVAELVTRPVPRAPSLVSIEPVQTLPALRGRVDDILRRFGAEHSAGIDKRLRDSPAVAVVGTMEEMAQVQAAIGQANINLAHLAVTDVRLGDVDAIVLGAGVDRSRLADVLKESPAGPLAILELSAIEWRADFDHVVDVIDRRSEVVRASAALAQLDDDVRRAGSVALSDSWMHVREHVERLRFETAAFAELAALRAEVAGRIVLPAAQRAALRRILFEVDTAARLAMPTSTPDAPLLDAVVAQLGDWRAFEDSGRVPFTSRTAVEAVIRCLERIWAGLAGYEPPD
jgi:serine/threonine protein kinase